MKKYSVVIAFIAIVITLIIPVGYANADSPSVDDVAVFQSYEEEGDWLIVCTYNISGTNTSTSLCNPYLYVWDVQLIDNEGSSILTNNRLQQCGMKPASIYINSTFADSLVWGGNYSVKIIGEWGTNPNASLSLTNWIGSDLRYLDAWVIYQAGVIGDFYSLDYIESVPVYGDVLNTDGGTIFDIGIPYLSSYRPNIFLVTVENFTMEYEENTGDSTYADDLYANFNTSMGTELAPLLYTIGGYFGVDGRQIAMIFLILTGLLMACIMEKSIGMLVIIFGVLVGVLHLYVILGFILLLGVIFVRGWFWSST